MATASAGIIVGCVSLGLGQQITSFVEILSGGNIFLLLLITALASLLLGMGLPTTANYIIMASLTAPILVQLASGIVVHGVALAVPLIAAHLYCFYFGILADDTPPVGLAAYAAAAIADTSPIATGIQGFLYDIRTAILPLMFIFNHDIILWGIDSVPEGIFLFFMTVARLHVLRLAHAGLVHRQKHPAGCPAPRVLHDHHALPGPTDGLLPAA